MSLLAMACEGPSRAISAQGGPVPSFVRRALRRRLGVHDADAEDVCQEAFVIVYQRLASFPGRHTAAGSNRSASRNYLQTSGVTGTGGWDTTVSSGGGSAPGTSGVTGTGGWGG
ncbi:sigma factor [Sorangium sp. So ce281]|uniref:RNA polymerase sigma factor n=1 Tax=unclassified Sorangium TaxID=2621164 RepID=UPI003F5F8803